MVDVYGAIGIKCLLTSWLHIVTKIINCILISSKVHDGGKLLPTEIY